MECIFFFLLGLLPAFITVNNPKKHTKKFVVWWIFGTFLPFIALPWAIINQLDEQRKDRPWLATRWKRLWGALIDRLLQLVLQALFLWATGTLQKLFNDIKFTYSEQILIVGLDFMSFTLLNVYLLYTKGQTIGKYFVGTTIVDMERRKANIWSSLFLRYYLIMLVGFIPRIGSFIVWLDPFLIFRTDYRCLHDHLAGTQVVDENWVLVDSNVSV